MWAKRKAEKAKWVHKEYSAPLMFSGDQVEPDAIPAAPPPPTAKRLFIRRVVVESPYKGNVEFNTRYARECLRDCLNRGEAPIASHLLYTQPGILDDNHPEERSWGIDASLMWGTMAHVTVVYTDLGTTEGMVHGIAAAVRQGRAIEYRSIPGWIKNQISAP